jgi:hypothetical protein
MGTEPLMEQLRCFGDDRNKGYCIHCGGPSETRDHSPSKVFLDEPYPENLPVCPSCLRCNNAISIDEEYLACFLECVLAGDVDSASFQRSRIARLLDGKTALLERLRKSRMDVEGVPTWKVETERAKSVVLKLARGHAAYELNEPRTDLPLYIDFKPLRRMSDEAREAFEGHSATLVAPWPEVGSRAMQRLLVLGSEVYTEGWVVVQESNYRFRTSQEGGLRIQMVLREYLACQVCWE